MEIITIDDQPYSIVEDNGFHRLVAKLEPCDVLLGRKYLSNGCLPELYNVFANHIHELLATDVTAISFTKDIRSSDMRLVCLV